MRKTGHLKSHAGHRRRLHLYALILVLGMLLLAFLPVGPASRLIPTARAHALPVRASPAPDSILRKAPTKVTIWFDDALVAANSHISVLDPKGNVVDRRDSRVSGSNPREMSVTLAKLPAGTYTVLWVAQSADDGHITEGSFVFSVTLPDGTVPPLPSGSSQDGGTSTVASFEVNGPILFQAIATWLALLGMTFWLGGLIWETWVLTPGASDDPDLARASWVASRRFRRLVPYALSMILLADVALVLGQAAALTGHWSSAFAPSSLQSILFGSHFGLFWWMRQGVVLAALGLWWLSGRRGWSPLRAGEQEAASAQSGEEQLVPDWWRGVLQVIRDIPHLPARLLLGWRRSARVRRVELLLGALLLVAFAFTGHAAAVPSSEWGFSISIDLLHLVGNAAWVGGLLYIGLVLVPSLHKLGTRSRARVLARGLPAFSVLAATSAVMLATTGPLDATVHMTSIQQFLTTPYGWTLAVKIECFLLMVAISIFHAFFLRPRLALAMNPPRPGAVMSVPERAQVEIASASASGKARAMSGAPEAPSQRAGEQGDGRGFVQVRSLAERMEVWLQREAALGVAVLLCVALLDVVFAGTLVPPL